jgi:hypothetical protein
MHAVRAFCFLALATSTQTVTAVPPNGAVDATFPGRRTAEELKQQGFAPLFDGTSLDHWDVKPWHERHWVARDRVIDYDGKAEGKAAENSLWTKESFGDIVLYAEWRLPSPLAPKPHPIVLYNGDFLLDDNGKRVTRLRADAGDSGIVFRGTQKCQANIWSQELGSGEINGYRTDRKMPPEVRRGAIPIKNADRAAGEWNAFLITLKGDEMTVELNSETVIPTVRLPDLPPAGPIGLQHHGDPVQFRNIWVKKL